MIDNILNVPNRQPDALFKRFKSEYPNKRYEGSYFNKRLNIFDDYTQRVIPIQSPEIYNYEQLSDYITSKACINCSYRIVSDCINLCLSTFINNVKLPESFKNLNCYRAYLNIFDDKLIDYGLPSQSLMPA